MKNNNFIIRLRTLSLFLPNWLYGAHRFLFRVTNGAWNRSFGAIVSLLNSGYTNLKKESELIGLSEQNVDATVAELQKNGYSILENKLSPEIVERLYLFAQNSPLEAVLPNDNYEKEKIHSLDQTVSYDEGKKQSSRCLIPQNHVLSNEDIHNIMTDPALLSIAQDYLGAKPILGSVTMWWSFPPSSDKDFASGTGQKYHFDMDHVNFFNVFIYLTDVGSENGPHCYVKNSHNKLPKIFRQRGRFDDNDIKDYYSEENVLELTAEKGTIMAVDTMGLHKGKPLESGERLILQLHFATSLFGKTYPKGTVTNMKPDQMAFMEEHRHSYFHYF